jgi:hypothetical protein
LRFEENREFQLSRIAKGLVFFGQKSKSTLFFISNHDKNLMLLDERQIVVQNHAEKE